MKCIHYETLSLFNIYRETKNFLHPRVCIWNDQNRKAREPSINTWRVCKMIIPSNCCLQVRRMSAWIPYYIDRFRQFYDSTQADILEPFKSSSRDGVCHVKGLRFQPFNERWTLIGPTAKFSLIGFAPDPPMFLACSRPVWLYRGLSLWKTAVNRSLWNSNTLIHSP